jgi:hypothetical protein
MASVFTTLY